MNQTLEQQRAKHALELVRQAKRKRPGEKEQGEFKREVKKLPVRIMTSGLGPALAFLKEKGRAKELVEGINEWMAVRLKPAGHRDLLERVIDGDAMFLRRATAETLAYLQWVKRFVETEEFKGEENG